MTKYTNFVTEINPMGTAPVWGYYSGNIETVILFFRHPDDNSIVTCIGYYNREYSYWVEYYSSLKVEFELIGWLPDYKYIKGE